MTTGSISPTEFLRKLRCTIAAKLGAAVGGLTPIINAPNTAILGVGRLRDDTAWTDYGTPYRVSRLTLSLTWDHRAFDGAPAAEFCRAIKHHLENVGE